MLAGWDDPSASTRLSIDLGHPEVTKTLAACDPSPARVEAPAFTDHFRHPLDCLNSLRRAQGMAPLDKNDPDVGDALREMTRGELLPLIESRAPDLSRLAERVRSLIEG